MVALPVEPRPGGHHAPFGGHDLGWAQRARGISPWGCRAGAPTARA